MLKNKLISEKWRPDRTSVVPLFKQIYDFIITRIASGEWSIGSKLPTQMEMAKSFDVNRSTILEVYDELKAEGIVESRRSSGTLIVNNTWSLLTASAPLDWSKRISKSIHEPNLNMIKIINDIKPDESVIRLGAGELARDLAPTKYMDDIMKNMAKEIAYMGYEDSKGLLCLREEICNYLKTRGIETQASKILIVSGALQALHLISTGLLHRGSSIITEKPSYIQSLTLFDSYGINLLGVDMDSSGMRLDQVTKRIVTKRPDLLYTISNFQNPTGRLMSEQYRKSLLELCEKERLAIIEDDVYSELWYESPPPLPIKAQDKNGTVLYIGSVSKTLSAGLRIGWVVANENVIDRLADIKMQTDYGSSNMSQWMCYEFFRSGSYKAFTEELRQTLQAKRALVLKVLEEEFSDIATWTKPPGGLYVWVKFKQEMPSYKLFERCYKEGIIINPGSLYDPADKNGMRISFGYATSEDLEQGLIKLSDIIKSEFINN